MIIWLASYPKSGNTWVRSFLCHYIYGNNDNFNFKLLDNIKKFPDINVIKNLKINYENTNELIENWTVMQDFINLNNKLNFLKIDLYKTLEIMKSDEYWETEDKFNNFRSALFGSWKTNYKSWFSQNTLETLLIRYEDLILNPFENFSKIIKFLENKSKIIYDKNSIELSINQTKFENLSKLEKKNGFDEATNDLFFRKGSSKQWMNLDKKLISDLEENFGDLMEDLNYK